jgi:hypothetical protein
VTGFAWRIQIPTGSVIYGSNLVNNLLEFLGMAINILLELRSCTRGQNDCILALGDNTSAVGWLHNTTKLGPGNGSRKAHLMVARHIAHEVLDMDCYITSQHTKGELNLIAFLLSFGGNLTRAGGKMHPLAADDPPNDVLTQRLHSTYPDQILAHFVISQLLDDILSWALRVLQTTASLLIADKRAATKTTTESGVDGSDSASKQAALLTPSALLYLQMTENFSPNLSLLVTAPPNGPKKGLLMDGITSRCWLQVLCKKPQATWLRRFRTISNQAPFTSKGRPSCIPLRVPSSQPSKTSIRPLSAKKQQPQSCCDECSTIAFSTIAELAIFAFFFAMRSCENTSMPKSGRTKIVYLLGLIFRNHCKRMIPHRHPGLSMAVYITVIFVSQKNHKKMDKRTQRRATDAILCPVKRAASLVEHILRLLPNHSTATTINTVYFCKAPPLP